MYTSPLPLTIEGVRGPGAKDAATKGGDLVTIVGHSFGPPTNAALGIYPPRVSYGGNGADMYNATGCVVVRDDVEIQCLTPAIAVGG